MLPDSKIMIHDPSFSADHNMSGMKPHELQRELDDLNKYKIKLAELISERTGKTIEEVYEATKDDTFFDTNEAINFKLCTGIYNLNERK